MNKSVKHFGTVVNEENYKKRMSIQNIAQNLTFTKSNKEYIDQNKCFICDIEFNTFLHSKKHWYKIKIVYLMIK